MYIHAYIHTYIYTHMHTCVHAYTDAHTYHSFLVSIIVQGTGSSLEAVFVQVYLR